MTSVYVEDDIGDTECISLEGDGVAVVHYGAGGSFSGSCDINVRIPILEISLCTRTSLIGSVPMCKH